MNTEVLTIVLVLVAVVIGIAGVFAKLYTRQYLKDIDGFRGIHKKKEFRKKG